MKPVLASCYFGGGQYPRLARVLEASARTHAPAWTIEVVRLEPPAVGNMDRESDVFNHYKLEWWTRRACDAPDDTRLLLVDVDTFVTGPLDDLWEREYDFAYTRRASVLYPLNAGVVALRVNARSRAFMRAWLDIDSRMRADRDLLERWRRKYAGHNQAALGCLLETGDFDARVIHVPCELWNCEDTAWRRFGPSTRIVHVKSALRMAIFDVGVRVRAQPLIKAWKKIDRACETRLDQSVVQ